MSESINNSVSLAWSELHLTLVWIDMMRDSVLLILCLTDKAALFRAAFSRRSGDLRGDVVPDDGDDKATPEWGWREIRR